jgi:hypothetical protein
MPRFLFIVARQLPAVYEHLRQQFAEEPNVQVILDRRQTDRREPEPATPAGEERPPAERRQNPGVDDQIRTLGYAFVRLPD